MKQEHINFIRLRHSTLKDTPQFIIVGGETVDFNLSYCVVYEYMYGWYKSLSNTKSKVEVVEPSMNTISLHCRISLSTAKRVMKHLEQSGLIVVERTKGESNKYVCVRELNCAQWSDKQRTRSDTKGTKHDVTKQPNKNLHLKQLEIKEVKPVDSTKSVCVEPEVKAEEHFPDPEITLWQKHKDNLILSNREKWECLSYASQQHVMIAVNNSTSDKYLPIKNLFDVKVAEMLRSQQPKSEVVQAKPEQSENYDINDLFNCVDHDDSFDKYQQHTHNANKQESVEIDWSDADEFNFSDDVPF